ncbi:MAG: helix-turn-helix domain-containing protein [Planctomycetota bacterium]
MPRKPIFISLSPQELERLRNFMAKMVRRRNVRASQRVNALWASSEQHWTVEKIAKWLNRSPHTIYRWFRRYQKKGIDGLYDTPATKNKLTDEQISQILVMSHRLKRPRDGKEALMRWSYQKIARWIKEQWDINISDEGVRKIIRKKILGDVI